MATEAEFKKEAAEFRKHVPDLNTPRFQVAKTQTPYEYSEAFQKDHMPPWLFNLTQAWEELLKEPFKGVTNDGNIRPDLFQLQDGGVEIEGVTKAVDVVLSKLDDGQKKKLRYPMNAREWRAWSNPEFLLRPFGLRLEELPEDTAESIVAVLKATFPADGFQKALAAMHMNHFLGEVCEVPKIMNKYSYNFLLFGEPSATEAWGWSLYGHHLCLNVFLKGKHIAVTPTFTGAEPNIIDSGPWEGTQILHEEGKLGLRLMQSLPQEAKDKTQIYKLMRDPGMLQTGDLIVDRWNQDDQRHVCGAFRDNRVVAYEGIVASSMTDEQRNLILDIAEQFLLYHPHKARELKKKQIAEHFDETYFCWTGGYGDDDAYYFRIQSPVIVFEFDHHSGVFLSNKEPAKFHTHTLVRTPNSGDYGNALRKPEDRVS